MNKIRRTLFWGIDFFKGGSVKKHLDEVIYINENFASKEANVLRNKYLSRLLTHAVKTTSFYSDYSPKDGLLSFPIINKNLIRDNFKAFKSKQYENKKLLVASTSGSTGAPFKVLQDKNKRIRSIADNIFFARQAGYMLGDKLFYIKIWSKSSRIKKIKNWLRNINPHSVYDLDDNDISQLIKRIESQKHRVGLIGYASSFRIICNYLDKIQSKPIDSKVKSIITISERLDKKTKKRLSYYFNCPVVSRYSNNENGMLAQQNIKKNKRFHLNIASYFIEILDFNKDEPVKDGVPGRVVITDLFNYAMPIIRYDVGDVAITKKTKKGITYIKRIEGRVLDSIFNTKGERVSSHLAYHLCKYGDFKQFQLVQSGEKEYSINLNTTKKVEEEKMLLEFKEYLGSDANININYVDDIPLLASGKRREVTNTYINSKT